MGIASTGPAGERQGVAAAAVDSRTQGETSAAKVSWDTAMNLTPRAFRSSKCRMAASSNCWKLSDIASIVIT